MRRVFLVLAVVGCSSADRPNADVLLAEVGSALTGSTLASRECDETAVSAKVTSVTKVDVVEWGEKNEKQGYLPVRVTISGTCSYQTYCGTGGPTAPDAVRPVCPTHTKDFVGTKPNLVRFLKDDFGKWSGRLASE